MYSPLSEEDSDKSAVSGNTSAHPPPLLPHLHLSGAAMKKQAYKFDGLGNYSTKEWDFSSVGSAGATINEFSWYHVELPKFEHINISAAAKHLIAVLCPPLKLQDILTLASNGPFCAHVDGALFFRVNSPGPVRLAARVTEKSVISVTLGRIPRLGFSRAGRRSLLSEIPRVDESSIEMEDGNVVIKEHVLEFLLTINHSEEADNQVPNSVSNLVVHIIVSYVDHVGDIVTKLEMELDEVEPELDKGGSELKKQMLDDRRFPKMLLKVQRLLQVVAHGEQVFPRVKEKCGTKKWLASEDGVALEELIGRLRRIKENLGFIVSRITAAQASLDSWQSEQINRKLYCLSLLSIMFLPWSIITGLFGMNVGGVPWTEQDDPAPQNGFVNVLMLGAGVLVLPIFYFFFFPSLYGGIAELIRLASAKKNWSLHRNSFSRRTPSKGVCNGGGYLPI